MMNYIQGKNLDLKQLGFEFKDKQWSCPSPKSLGLSSKLLYFLRNYIQNTTKEELINDFDLTKAKATKICDNKEVILNKMDNNILWHSFSKDSKSDAKFWEDLLNFAISKISFRIDPMSSSDIYKIMRMPDTIHGGTGFLSSTIKTRDDLVKFNPLSDTVIFREDKTKRIEITRPINKFKLIDKEFGPFTIGERIDLPEAVSVYLLLKGVAK
jgi:DNA primase small subunit